MPAAEKELITLEEVRRVARLARLRVDEEGCKVMQGELNGALMMIKPLMDVDTEGVEPLPSPVDTPLPLREDEVTDGDCTDAVLSNGPETTEGFYVVSKVVE